MKIPKTIVGTLVFLDREFGINTNISRECIYLLGGVPFVSTVTVARILRTDRHTLSITYVKPLIAGGVKRVILGSKKFYCLEDIVKLLVKSIAEQKTILELCVLQTRKRGKHARRNL